jgi:hypothetical protein
MTVDAFSGRLADSVIRGGYDDVLKENDPHTKQNSDFLHYNLLMRLLR